MAPARILLSSFLAALILVTVPIGVEEVFAGSRGGFSSSKGFSKSHGVGYSNSSSWSYTTKSTWNRNGGGLLGVGEKTSSGYSKPSLNKSTAPANYSKPRLTPPVGQDYHQPNNGGNFTSSSGYSKPSPNRETKTESGYSKPLSTSAGGNTFSGGSKFDKQTILLEQKKRSQESLDRYKTEQSRFVKPEYRVEGAASSPLADKAKVYSGFDYARHYDRRDNFFGARGYQPPAYAFNTSPSFGLFNTIFLFWMLDNVSNKNVAATAYHHSNDPGFQKWRQEVEEQARDNADLKAKLAEMDRQIKVLDGTPRNPGYLPSDVPPEAALAAGVLAEKKPEKPVLRLATGQSGGWYGKFGDMFASTTNGLTVRIIPTAGSLENLKLIASGEADLGIVQSDLFALLEKKMPGKEFVTEQATLYDEYVQLLANKGGGVQSIKDLDATRHVMWVGPKGSGTATTWEVLCEKEKRFGRIPVKYGDYLVCLDEVKKNPKALMLFVGGLKSDFLARAEETAKKTGQLRLVAVDEPKLAKQLDNNGNTIYRFAKVPANIYPYLQKGWLFGSDVKTLVVQAVLVLRSDWPTKFGTQAMDVLSLAILKTRPEIERVVNGVN